jgi:hypothetical protein
MNEQGLRVIRVVRFKYSTPYLQEIYHGEVRKGRVNTQTQLNYASCLVRSGNKVRLFLCFLSDLGH